MGLRLFDYIKEHEGYSGTIYYLNDIPHIGYGHNLRIPITNGAANHILGDDLWQTRLNLNKAFLPISSLREHLETRERYIALMDMMFHLGFGSFSGFKLMIQAIKDKRWEEAAAEVLDSKYAKQHIRRAIENADLIKGQKGEQE